MDAADPDWLLLALGVLADLAVLYGGFRLVRRFRRRRAREGVRDEAARRP